MRLSTLLWVVYGCFIGKPDTGTRTCPCLVFGSTNARDSRPPDTTFPQLSGRSFWRAACQESSRIRSNDGLRMKTPQASKDRGQFGPLDFHQMRLKPKKDRNTAGNRGAPTLKGTLCWRKKDTAHVFFGIPSLPHTDLATRSLTCSERHRTPSGPGRTASLSKVSKHKHCVVRAVLRE